MGIIPSSLASLFIYEFLQASSPLFMPTGCHHLTNAVCCCGLIVPGASWPCPSSSAVFHQFCFTAPPVGPPYLQLTLRSPWHSPQTLQLQALKLPPCLPSFCPLLPMHSS